MPGHQQWPGYVSKLQPMRKIISAASCLFLAAVTVVAASGCADQVRTVPASNTTNAAAKPNFKTAIQNNPNIPDNVKQKFGGAGAH